MASRKTAAALLEVTHHLRSDPSVEIERAVVMPGRLKVWRRKDNQERVERHDVERRVREQKR